MVPDEPLDQLDGVRVHNLLVMLGSEAVGDRARERTLVEPIAVLEPDRERLHRFADHAGHQRHDRARVDAPAEECSERDIRDQAPANCPFELGSGFGRRLLQPDVERSVSRRTLQLPVALQPRLPAGLERQRVRRRQASDPVIEGERRRHVTECQVGRQGAFVELAGNGGVGEHPFDFAGEDERVRAGPVVERLLAEAIAAER